jgi:hypothetical protein
MALMDFMADNHLLAHMLSPMVAAVVVGTALLALMAHHFAMASRLEAQRIAVEARAVRAATKRSR